MDASSLTQPVAPARPRVVVVESDADLRGTLREVLEGDGYQVVGAGDVREAREALTTARPALVLLALRVEGESTEPLLAELLAEHNPHPTVVVAGSKRAEAVALEYGVRCVSKPFDLDALLHVVRDSILDATAG